MNMKTNEVLFKINKQSNRSLEADELISLISSTTVSRQSLMRLTGNILRNDLSKLEKNRMVKVKETNVLSATAPEKYYYVSKFNIKGAKSADLVSFAVYYLRAKNLKLGRVDFKENSNALANMIIDETTYSQLEFISLDAQTYERKLSQLMHDNTQKVLVVDGKSLLKNIVAKYDITNCLVLTVFNVKNKRVINGIYIDEDNSVVILDDNFDYSTLNTTRGADTVDLIEESYVRAEQARARMNFKK